MATLIDTTHTAAASADTYAFTFPYLETTDVKIEIDGVSETDFTVSGSSITFGSGSIPVDGSAIVIFRDTDVDAPVVTWSNKTYLDPDSLDLQNDQVLYKLQETASDNTAVEISSLETRVTTLEGEDHASIAYVDSSQATQDAVIATKATTATVATKASITYVDTQDAALQVSIDAKADVAYVDATAVALTATITPKADTTYVDANDAATLVSANAYTDANGGGGGGGGSSTLVGLTDTTIATPTDGQVLTYDNGTSKWVNQASSGGSAPVLDNPAVVQFGYDGGQGDITAGGGTTSGLYYVPLLSQGSYFLANTGNSSCTLNATGMGLDFSVSGTYSLDFDIPYFFMSAANSYLKFEWYRGSDANQLSATGTGLVIDNCPSTASDFPGVPGTSTSGTLRRMRPSFATTIFTIDHTNPAENFITLWVNKTNPNLATSNVADPSATWGLQAVVRRLA